MGNNNIADEGANPIKYVQYQDLKCQQDKKIEPILFANRSIRLFRTILVLKDVL